MKVAIIGAGIGGTKLLNLFKDMDNVVIGLVVDKNYNAPGIILAQEHNIKYSNSMNDIDDSIDVIIEATGIKEMADTIKDKFSEKQIVDSKMAQLMMNIVDKQILISDQLNNQLNVINKTTKVLKKEMDKVSTTTKFLNDVSHNLIHSSNESKQYINESDEIIDSVNHITQQIKILGLNANIEAARAGEHGRGFSVVANEVQKLSDNTKMFADEISGLLKSLSKENENINTQIEKLSNLTEEQDDMATNVNEVIEELVTKVAR
ncbi:methyl-accepting chemotaxis protein [Vallitalea longa]|uniref:Methyl-accepting chemotaxis protein n=1 Tax=Vallitalea longa TaxID=2936439 RepID=A0A9W5YEY4_9FIRM|nr:methyl-accepting chemotaxis protein [Vallitalea longa]GKX29968.1 methyl-accepting chemotaxis protein [Vallitalea longa]